MRLNKIKLAGFKSFVEPTTIAFPQQMTAVVGPNGCGKSNVIDAIRWVLGESSAKNLRGDAMTDVIFNGSSARKPVSQASVELFFDNSSGRLQGEYAGFNELSVRRTVNRDGQSHYFLNGTKCRRRDVTDLFLGTGLGPRSYAIIEQGTISRLIESKPQELRIFIEEAAGVSKYKERRKDTENRIRHTNDNLARLQDVQQELEQQLERLDEQAQSAAKYKALKQQERRYQAQLAGLRYRGFATRIAGIKQTISEHQQALVSRTAEQRQDQQSLLVAQQQQQDIKQALSDLQRDGFAVATEITKIEQQQLHANQRKKDLKARLQDLSQQHQTSQHSIEQSTERLSELSADIKALTVQQTSQAQQLEQRQIDSTEAQRQAQAEAEQFNQFEQLRLRSSQQLHALQAQLQSAEEMCSRSQQEVNELDKSLTQSEQQQATEELASLQQQVTAFHGQLDELAQHIDSKRDLVDLAQQGLQHCNAQVDQTLGQLHSVNAKLDGLQSMQQASDQPIDLQQLADDMPSQGPSESNLGHWWQQLDVESPWGLALESVCQQWQQSLYLPKTEDTQSLAKTEHSWIIGTPQTPLAENALLNKVSTQYWPSWMANIATAETDADALNMMPGLSDEQSVVTPSGLWVGNNWIKRSQDPSLGYFKRKEQIEQLTQQRDTCDDNYRDARQQRQQAEEQLSIHKQGLARATATHTAVTHNLDSAQTRIQWLNTQQQSLAEQRQQLMIKRDTQRQQLETETSRCASLKQEVTQLTTSCEQQQQQADEMAATCQQAKGRADKLRKQIEQDTSAYHKDELLLQNLRNQQQNLMQSSSKEHAQQAIVKAEQGRIQASLDELSIPLADQQSLLQQLLDKKLAAEQQAEQSNAQLVALSEQIASIEQRQKDDGKSADVLQGKIHRLELDMEGLTTKAASIEEQIVEMGHQLDEVINDLPEQASVNRWQQQLESLEQQVAELGAVNLAADDEYQSLSARKQHLDEQSDDLRQALDMLEQAIRKMDRETRSRFKQTFDQINQDLQALFPKVFGGGKAYLALTDDNLLETGVSIMAQPPGKKNSTIHLLSGGEKALTALSLVFAIFRLNPAPFCLLDEVDAPLDDANVGRFCKLVSEMSQEVQFIYITHNKIAMEMASHLTGVTMAEAGVSRMVAVDVEEAVAMAIA